MKIGVSTWFWVWHFTSSDVGLVERVARLGFDWIEIPVESVDQPIDCRAAGGAIRILDDPASAKRLCDMAKSLTCPL